MWQSWRARRGLWASRVPCSSWCSPWARARHSAPSQAPVAANSRLWPAANPRPRPPRAVKAATAAPPGAPALSAGLTSPLLASSTLASHMSTLKRVGLVSRSDASQFCPRVQYIEANGISILSHSVSSYGPSKSVSKKMKAAMSSMHTS